MATAAPISKVGQKSCQSSHVGWDTETHKRDTGTVDLENSYWKSMEKNYCQTSKRLLLPGYVTTILNWYETRFGGHSYT